MLNRRSLLTRRTFAKALYLLFITSLLTTALGTAPAQLTQAKPSALAEAASPEGLVNPDGTLDLSSGFEGALDLRGWEVILDGKRGPVLKPASLHAAALTTAWHVLPNQGLNLRVRALAMVGSNMYVGGRFMQTNDGSVTNLSRIARFDTVAGTWHALSNQGLNDEVTALTLVGNDLYVGGIFTQTVDGSLTNLGNVARYNTTTATWHALSNQGLNVNSQVFTLTAMGNDLYVGGTFNQTGDGLVTNLSRIARYDMAVSTWHALPNQGLNGNVYALATDGSDVYVGGGFTQTNDGVLNLGHVARYDTTTAIWHALSNQGLDGDVAALAVSDGNLYVGGGFTQTGDGVVPNIDYVARYDMMADTWHKLNQGLNGRVSALAVVDNDLYVGGEFNQSGDGSLTSLGYVAHYDTTTTIWSALPNQGLNNWVYVLAVVDSDLYVGGEFNQTGDGSANLGHIARYGEGDHTIYLPLVMRQ